MREFDPRRFGPYADQTYQVAKAKEDYLLRHEIPFPHFNRTGVRPVKTSPLYERLAAKGAVHEEVYGWERPRWFAPASVEAKDIYGFRRTSLHQIVGAECRAVREAAGVMDISAFSKVEVMGPDAAAFLDRLIPNRLPNAPGRIALTHLLNDAGRIELEATIVRFAEDRFYLVCAAFFERRLVDYLEFAKAGEDVTVVNRSSEWGALTLNGPRAREILAACTDESLTAPDFPWMRAKEIVVAGHSVWAFRMSYAGELGWEFHGPFDAIAAIYDALWAAGEGHGLRDYGSFAMNALRMEKAFKGAGELTNEVTVREADVMRFVREDKDFRGKAGSLAEPRFTCVYLSVDGDGRSDGNGGEAVLSEGRQVGAVSSIAWGHGVGRLLAFAYVKPALAAPGTRLQVVVMGVARDAEVLAGPVYDPGNEGPRS